MLGLEKERESEEEGVRDSERKRERESVNSSGEAAVSGVVSAIQFRFFDFFLTEPKAIEISRLKSF